MDLSYAEMVSDKAICYDNRKTIDMLYMEDGERPIAPTDILVVMWKAL